MMEYVEFSTPEDVELGFELAGPSSRFGGYALDRILLLLFQVLLFVMFMAFDLAGPIGVDGSGVLLAFYIALFGFSEFLYFGLCEWRSNGSSPGKRKVGMRVVMAGGHRLTPTAVLVRNLFRPIDMIPLFWIVPLLDSQCRRIGDFVAGTLVVRSSKVAPGFVGVPLANRKYSDLAERHVDLSGLDQGLLGAQDFHAIEEYLTRAKTFPRAQRQHLAAILLAPILKKLKRPAFEEYAQRGIQAHMMLKEIYLALRENPRLME